MIGRILSTELSTEISCFWAAIVFVVVAADAACAAEPRQEDAAQFLAFETRPDPTCYLLSRDGGGKKRFLINNHPSRSIKYRAKRFVSGKTQPGFAAGLIGPGGEITPLGCSEVGGHQQTWEIHRASFDEK